MSRTAIEGSFMESGMELANMDSVLVPTIAPTSQLRDCLTMTKPEVMFLVIIAAGVGGFMAARVLNPVPLFHAVFGTALMAGGAATLNHYIERFPDVRIRRTAIKSSLGRHVMGDN